jgi:hypothetical protein
MLKKAMKKNPKKLALNLSIKSPAATATTTNVVIQSSSQEECHNMQEYKSESLLYRQGPACILPNLYLGAHYNASNTAQLAQFNIRCIINVASEITLITIPNNIEYHHLRWTHNQNNLARVEFAQAISKIEYAHSKQQNVLIHCQQGIERSAALVIAYLLSTSRQCGRITKTAGGSCGNNSLAGQNWSLDRALKYVQEKASGIRPNMEILYQLREYEKLIIPPPSLETRTISLRTRTKRSESITGCGSSVIKKMATSSSLRNLAVVTNTRPRATSFRDTSTRTFSYTAKPIAAASVAVKKEDDRQKVLATASLLVVLAAICQQQQNSQQQGEVEEEDDDEENDNTMKHSFFLMKPVYPIY